MAAQPPILAYLDRLSARGGERIEVKVSVAAPGPCRARLERLICGDPNPAGPGMAFEDLRAVFETGFAGRRQAIHLGSYGEAPGPTLGPARGATWTALVWPTLESEQIQPVLVHEGGGVRVILALEPDAVVARLANTGGERVVRTDRPAPLNRWSRVWVSLDRSGALAVGLAAPGHHYAPAFETSHRAPGKVALPSGGVVTIGGGFTGKIEDPAVLRGSRDRWPGPLASLAELKDDLLAGWDFTQGISTQRMAAVGPRGRAGRLVNLPMRAVPGTRWRPESPPWPQAREAYGAIRFHADDLGDAGWATDFIFEVPRPLKSGAYGLRLSCTEGEDWVPFYVLPPKRAKAASRPNVCLLAPTFTYQAYGNHARGRTGRKWRTRVRDWRAYPLSPDDHPQLGRSTYNRHADGTGIAYASRLRPLLTMRPGYLTFADPAGSGLRHYPADSHILAWLEAKAIAFDVITDEDLDTEGASLIAPYRLVLTGSHPEYHTTATLDALQAHVSAGRSLAYLGGNGFYWKIARAPDASWAIEVRRGETGERMWTSEVGERWHAFDGRLGGLWRNLGRPPQALVGVGMSAQGPFAAGRFRRTRQSYDPALAWMFEGVEGDLIGAAGLNAGGGAGFELDRLDVKLGSPPDATVVARSEALPVGFFPVPEDMEGGDPAEAAELVRADMTWFETAAGGAVFSAAAITFCGALWNGAAWDGAASRLLENVVRRLAG